MMRGILRIATTLTLVLACGVSFANESSTTRLSFTTEVQNLRISDQDLLEAPTADLELACDEIGGTVLYGRIPYRRFDEPATSSDNFLGFAVTYLEGARSTVWLDRDIDGRVTCEEQVPLVPHPRDGNVLFRTVALHWAGDGGPERSRRVRLSVPAGVVDGGHARYSLDLVDVPVARWTVDGHETTWVLYDGNHNGVYDARFGDGILVDLMGEGRLDVDPYGANFLSYHGVAELPWGSYEIDEVDPLGASLALVPAFGDFDSAPFEVGDVVSASKCRSGAGESVQVTGTTSGYRLVYFWLSSCGGCGVDMKSLLPLLEAIDATRLSAIGVSLDENAASYEEFVRTHEPEWPQCFSGRMLWDNRLARKFGVRDPSDFVILDAEDRIVALGNGFPEIEKHLLELSLVESAATVAAEAGSDP